MEQRIEDTEEDTELSAEGFHDRISRLEIIVAAQSYEICELKMKGVRHETDEK